MRLDDSDDLFNFDNQQLPIPFTKHQEDLSKIYKEPLSQYESLETFLERIALRRSIIYRTNISKYPYARAHNYHFYCDSFERIPDQPTYALDYSNCFFSTFLQEDKLYKGQRLDHIINRVAFTLPMSTNESSYFLERKCGSSHNPAHSLLFENEDAKYQIDRQITTLKRILSKLDSMTISDLERYKLISGNSFMQFLLSTDLFVEQKREKLQKAISNLVKLKIFKSEVWQGNDALYFYSSIQQKLHDYVGEQARVMRRMQQQLVRSYERKHQKMLQKLKYVEEDFSYAVRKMLSFYKSNTPSISEAKIQEMEFYAPLVREAVQFPLFVLNLGNEGLRNSVNTFILHYTRNNQLQSEDTISMVIARLFRSTCSQRVIKQISFSQSKKLALRIISEIQLIIEANRAQRQMVQLLDEHIKLEQQELERSKAIQTKMPLFKIGRNNKIQICEQEAKALLYYNRLCKALSFLEPFLSSNNEIIQILCSPFFKHLKHAFIGYLQNKTLAKLSDYAQLFITHAQMVFLESSETQREKFLFEFDGVSGVGVLWPRKEKKKEEKGKDLTYFKKIAMQKPSEQIDERQDIKDQGSEGELQIRKMEEYPFGKKVKQESHRQD